MTLEAATSLAFLAFHNTCYLGPSPICATPRAFQLYRSAIPSCMFFHSSISKIVMPGAEANKTTSLSRDMVEWNFPSASFCCSFELFQVLTKTYYVWMRASLLSKHANSQHFSLCCSVDYAKETGHYSGVFSYHQSESSFSQVTRVFNFLLKLYSPFQLQFIHHPHAVTV